MRPAGPRLAPLVALLSGCLTPTPAPRHLDPAHRWVDDNRARLDAMLDQYAGAARILRASCRLARRRR